MPLVPAAVQRYYDELKHVAVPASRTRHFKHATVRSVKAGVGKWKPLAVDLEALACFCDGEINDTGANAFLADIFNSTPGVGVLDTHAYNSPDGGSITTGYDIDIFSERFLRHIEEKYPEESIFSLKTLIVPINIPGHWQLGIVDFEHTQFVVFDTLSGGVATCHDFAQKMVSFFATYRERRFKGAKMPNFDAFAKLINTGVKGEPGPTQTDGTSCGVFMLFLAYIRANGHRVNLVRGSDAPALRALIAHAIGTGATAPLEAAIKHLQDRVFAKPKPPPARERSPETHMIGGPPQRMFSSQSARVPSYTGSLMMASWDTDNPPDLGRKRKTASVETPPDLGRSLRAERPMAPQTPHSIPRTAEKPVSLRTTEDTWKPEPIRITAPAASSSSSSFPVESLRTQWTPNYVGRAPQSHVTSNRSSQSQSSSPSSVASPSNGLSRKPVALNAGWWARSLAGKTD